MKGTVAVGDTVALLAVVALAVGLRLWGLGAESLWWDEVWSLRVARFNPSGILLEYINSDNNPPLYYLLLHYWIMLFGESEVALRLPSVIFGALGVVVLHRIGTLLLGPTTGLISSLIMALSAFHVRYSQEARTYSLLVFLTLLSFFFFIKLLRGKSLPSAFGYVAATSLLAYSHVYGLFVVIAQNAYLIALLLLSRSREEQPVLTLRRWITLQIVVMLLYTPGAVILANNLLNPQSTWNTVMYWLPEPSVEAVTRFFYVYSGNAPLTVMLAVFAVLAVAALFANKGSEVGEGSGQWREVCLLLTWLLTPILVPYAISKLGEPMLLDRYTIVASPAFYILAARGMDMVGNAFKAIAIRRYVMAGVVALAIVLSLEGTEEYFAADNKEKWKDVAGYINTHAEAGDLVLAHDPAALLPLDYYLEADVDKQPFLADHSQVSPEEIAGILPSAVEGHDRVWLVLYWVAPDNQLPSMFRQVYGEAEHHDIYAVADRYNQKGATIPYQHPIYLFLFQTNDVGAQEPQTAERHD